MCYMSCVLSKTFSPILQQLVKLGFVFFASVSELTTAWKSLAQSKAAVSTPGNVFCQVTVFVSLSEIIVLS